MTYVVYGSPPTPAPRPLADLWPGVRIVWQGWDGSKWDICGGTSSGVSLMPGVRGLTMPEYTHQKSVSEARPGSRWRSVQVSDRELFLPVSVYHDGGSQAWMEHDAAFQATLDPERPGLLSLFWPDGTKRTIAARFVDDGAKAWDFSPGLIGWTDYALTFYAEDPYWSGEPVTLEWGIGSGSVPFTGPADSAPDFYISPSQTTATATATNPGTESAFVTWTAVGPIDPGLVLGVGSALIGYPAGVAAGSTLVIDTQTVSARLNGTRVSRNLSPRAPAALEPGVDMPVKIVAGGSGIIRASFIPKYRRAL